MSAAMHVKATGSRAGQSYWLLYNGRICQELEVTLFEHGVGYRRKN